MIAHAMAALRLLRERNISDVCDNTLSDATSVEVFNDTMRDKISVQNEKTGGVPRRRRQFSFSTPLRVTPTRTAPLETATYGLQRCVYS
jgi:hypothetical protein